MPKLILPSGTLHEFPDGTSLQGMADSIGATPEEIANRVEYMRNSREWWAQKVKRLIDSRTDGFWDDRSLAVLLLEWMQEKWFLDEWRDWIYPAMPASVKSAFRGIMEEVEQDGYKLNLGCIGPGPAPYCDPERLKAIHAYILSTE